VDVGRRTFATPEETRARLEASGFTDIRVWTQDESTRIPPGEVLEMYLRTVCLRIHVERLPEDRRDRFVRRVAERLAGGTIDYVRLNIHARRNG
jgi:trans-aconitate 2-methyltransferase